MDEQQSNRQSTEITTETISRPLILLYLNVLPKWRDTIVFHSLNRTEAAISIPLKTSKPKKKISLTNTKKVDATNAGSVVHVLWGFSFYRELSETLASAK